MVEYFIGEKLNRSDFETLKHKLKGLPICESYNSATIMLPNGGDPQYIYIKYNEKRNVISLMIESFLHNKLKQVINEYKLEKINRIQKKREIPKK